MTIGETLALRLRQRDNDPRTIVYLPIVPTELELVTVALKVLLAHAVERPVDPALEQGEQGFRLVRGRSVRAHESYVPVVPTCIPGFPSSC